MSWGENGPKQLSLDRVFSLEIKTGTNLILNNPKSNNYDIVKDNN